MVTDLFEVLPQVDLKGTAGFGNCGLALFSALEVAACLFGPDFPLTCLLMKCIINSKSSFTQFKIHVSDSTFSFGFAVTDDVGYCCRRVLIFELACCCSLLTTFIDDIIL